MDRELAPDRKFTVEVTSPGECKRVLAIKVPEEELAREREVITQELRQELRVPGFRRGKVPLGFVAKNYADVIRSDAVRNLLPHVYEMAVMQEGLYPLGEPQFENLVTEEGDGLAFEAHFEVRPEVEIKGYDSVKVEVARTEISDEKVAETLEHLRERMAVYSDVDRAATSSDYVTIDYAPYLDNGEIDEPARQKGHPVDLSSEQLMPEFRTGLVGMQKDEEKDIAVAYPDDFPDEALRGKSRKLHATVVAVKEKLLPELDDAFAVRVDAKFDSVDALRNRIREDLESEEGRRFEHEVNEKIIAELIERNPFEVPEVMVRNYLTSLMEEDRRRRPNVEDEAKREQEIGELFREAAIRSIKKYVIVDAVRRQEKVELSEADIEARVSKLAESTGRPADEIREHLKHPDHRRSFENELLDEKVYDLLRENVEIQAA